MARKNSTKNKKEVSPSGYLEKLEKNVETNQSKVSLILGALIVLVIGVLIFNYFNRNQADLGPAQQAQTEETENGDVSPENLPGKYTVKEGDTLFLIAEKYYNDGSRFTNVAEANNLTDVNQIEVGQEIEIPKLETQLAQASTEPTDTVEPTDAPEPTASAEPTAEAEGTAAPSPAAEAEEETADAGTGTGGGNTTIWGPRIEGNTYTVVEGDWLSTIAGRAYGDIMAFDKIAKANNISNPDHIEPGMVLTIPR